MNFLVAAWYEFLKNARDIKMLAFIVVFPIVVSYLIGSAVQGFFKPDDGKPIEAAYVNLDKGAVGTGFDQFITSKEVGEKLKITAYPGLEQGQKALSDGNYTVLVYLPADLTEGILRGESREIEISGGKDAEFVTTLASSFASTVNANMAVVMAGGKPVQIERTEAVVRVNRTNNGAYPNLTDYYSVLVLLEALVIGAIFGAYITARQYGSDIHIRIRALPVNPWSLLFGKITGSVAYLMLMSAATILFTRYVYGVEWGGNVPALIGALAVFSLIVVCLGVICGRVFKKVSTAIMIVFVLMFFFGTVSGSVSPKSGVVALGFLTPNYYAKVLMFGSMYGYPAPVMAQSALWLVGMAVAVCLAVAALTRRVGYDSI